MRSYFQGIRPAGRRTASSQQDQVQSPNDVPVNDVDSFLINNHPIRTEGDALRTTYVSSNPPTLPPIPRVASQYYGSPDPASPSKPDNKAWGFKNDARAVSAESKATPSNPSELHGNSYNHSVEHGADINTRPISRGNYSRPIAPTSKHDEPHDPRKSNLRAYTDPFPPKPPQNQERPPPIPTISYQSKDLPSLPPLSPTVSPPAPPPVNTSNQPPSKTRFHRLNPMSLLARRRASQAATQANTETYHQPPNKMPVSNLPVDYDPRIRGSVVHDFSVPRPRRYVSSQDLVSTESRKPDDIPTGIYGQQRSMGGQELEVLRPVRTSHSDQGVESEKQRTPKFKEHFGNDINPRPLDHDHRRNQSATAILDRRQDGDLPLRYSPTPPQPRAHSEEFVHNPLVVELPASFPADTSLQSIIELDTPTTIKPEPERKSSPPTSPPNTRSRASSITDPNFQPAGLPKHFKSNASRFSFDLAGVGSAVQEKLLEERHRQKNASRTRSSTISGASIAEATEEEDDYDYSNMDFDDGLEEKIPGINADDDEEEFEERIPGINADESEEEEEEEEEEEYYSESESDSEDEDGVSNSFNDPLRSLEAMQRMSAAFNSLNLLKPATQDRPSSKGGFYKHQNNSLTNQRNQSPTRQESSIKAPSDNSMKSQPPVNKPTPVPQQPPSTVKPKDKAIVDDLYFDDGVIEDLDLQGSQPFDESVFDDEDSRIYGKPLRDLKPLPLVTEPKSDDSSEQSTRPISLESGVLAGNRATTADTSRTSVQPPDAVTTERRSALFGKEPIGPNFNRQPSLTHGNIHAYHDALANAANRAALEGRFDRNMVVEEEKPVEAEPADPRPRVSFSENETEEFPAYPEESAFDNDSYGFGFDDNDMDDDDIVAAANAEALENDDEGFYGSEFGFFANAGGSEAQYANGGYFGSPGMSGVKRSHSGRANGQEPSLTPITERSEWSQRNSVVSLSTMHQNFAPGLQSANLSQLAARIQDEEDNMSLSALIKLRRGAWGRDGTKSGPQSPNGSYKDATSPGLYGLSPPSTSHSGHHFPFGHVPSSGLSQAHSLPPQGLNITTVREPSLSPEPEAKPPHPLSNPLHEEPMSAGESETQDKLSPLLPTTSNTSDNILSPSSGIRRSGAVKSHSRSSSGAESVSYIKEKDEDGGGDRWVVEMRRKGEGGTIEVLGRQVVEGGRI